MDVSVIVISRNEEHNIRRTLRAIKSISSIYSYEIILVDSNSTDRTREIAAEEIAPENIFILDQSLPRNAATGRYFGSLHAKGKYIIFIDGDMEIDPHWIDTSINYLRDHQEVSVVTGIMKEVRTNKKRELIEVVDRPITKKLCGSFVISKDDLMSVGNFDYRLYVHEEVDLYYRLIASGNRTATLQKPMCTHYTLHPYSFAEIIRRYRNRYYDNYIFFFKKYLHQGHYKIIIREFGCYIGFGLFQVLSVLVFFCGNEIFKTSTTIFWFLFLLYKLMRHGRLKHVILNLISWEFYCLGFVRGLCKKYNP